MQKTLDKIIVIFLASFILLFPSFFLTTYSNVFDLPKIILMVGVILVLLVFFAVKLIVEGKFTIATSNADLPLLMLTAAYLISAFARTPNKMEAFMSPGIATVILGSFLIFQLTKIAFRSDKIVVAQTLVISGLILSLFSIFAYLGVFKSIPQLPEIMKRPEFSPLGGKLPEIILLLGILPLGVGLILDIKDSTKKLFYGMSVFIIVVSLALSATLMMPGKGSAPVIVDHQTSWEVAVDTLKVSPILGIGPGNYLSAFSRFLPLSYNQTPLWANRFLSGSSFVMTLVTETGILGLIAFALVVFSIVRKPLKNIKKSFSDKLNASYLVSFLVITVSMFILPAATGVIILFFFLSYLNSDNSDTTVNLSATSVKNGSLFVSKMPSAFLAVVLIAISLIMGVFGVRILSAEVKYKTAIEAIIANDAKLAYDSLRAAINTNGYVDRYHATNAQLNLALARSISQKADITENDRNTIGQLIQQAIAEAKATVALNPGRSANWETLARTYQAIMPFAQGADNFTVISFNQAIALDPINPNLRIGLGGVYYALGRYDDSINAFGLAVTAKPDLANAHYNLAIAYREKKDFDKAIGEMNTVLSLVQKDSQDYQLAMKTLDELKKAKPATPEQGAESLTPPQPAEEPALEPKLDLPQEATPPAQP
jgi:tetratricopeptide (TPR) repeat protein